MNIAIVMTVQRDEFGNSLYVQIRVGVLLGTGKNEQTQFDVAFQWEQHLFKIEQMGKDRPITFIVSVTP